MYQRHTAAAASADPPGTSSSPSYGGNVGAVVGVGGVGVVSGSAASAAGSGDPVAVRRRRKVGRKPNGSGGKLWWRSLGGSSWFERGSKAILPPRLRRQLQAVFNDEDLIVTLVQAASLLVLAGCAVVLFLHYGLVPSSSSTSGGGGDDGGDDGDDDGSPSGGGSWLGSLVATTAGWMFGGVGGGPSESSSLPARQLEKTRKANGLYPRKDLPPSKIYTIPDSLSFVGDKSDRYARLRKKYDNLDDLEDVVRKYELDTMPMDDVEKDGEAFSSKLPPPYDIHNCPDEPPLHYPYNWNLLELLHHWPPDDPSVPDDMKIYQGLCVFDYETDYDRAVKYRTAELPFVVRNDPQIMETVKRWNAPGYMEELMGPVQHRAEYSESNHFMYWAPPRGYRPERAGRPDRAAGGRPERPGRTRRAEKKEEEENKKRKENLPDGLKNWKEPTKMLRMTYLDWLSHANLTEQAAVGPDDPHWYFRLIGCGETGPEGECDRGSSEYLFDELPYFQPKEGLYIVDPIEQKGIHCRFGMNGVIAENHFDQSRNAIVVLGGERRYVLAHPNQCPLLSLLPKGHPSARHSAVDWSDPDLDTYPEFAHARANEVVLQAGDALYLPTNWFHYIISLSLNFQCNTRSGLTKEYMVPIRECGF